MKPIIQPGMTIPTLTEGEKGDLHQATLEILERTGVDVQETRARSLLLDAGARDGGGSRVRIPAWIVERALTTAPERIVMYGRDGQRVMPLEAGRTFFGTGSDTPNTIDPYSGERRSPVKDDVRKIALLCDACDEIDFVMGMGIPSDVPDLDTYVHEFDAMITGTSKPLVYTAHDNQDMETILEIATVVAGDEKTLRERPFMLLYTEPISPLIHTKMGTEKLLFCAEEGIPTSYPAAVLAGCSGPVTMAGAIAQANAEVLSGLVIHQLQSPGAPFLYGANVPAFDMQHGVCTYGSPESPIAYSVFAAMSRYYRLPSWGMAGATDSKVLDAQASSEATMSIFAALLSGCQLVHDVGYLDNGMTSSMEAILMCNEIISMCRRFTRGVEWDDNAFALDAIDQVGPGGHFLDSDHTLANFREAHWYPRFMDRRHV